MKFEPGLKDWDRNTVAAGHCTVIIVKMRHYFSEEDGRGSSGKWEDDTSKWGRLDREEVATLLATLPSSRSNPGMCQVVFLARVLE